jgi:RNA polymerase sigma factor (sigma-70 family)
MDPTASRDIWNRAIVEQNQRWLTAYFLAATGDRSTADDLVQEVFSQALESQGSFDSAKPFGAWLRGIARNLLARHYRNVRRSPLSLDGAALDQLDSQAALGESRSIDPDYQPTRLAALRECLRKLNERMQAMLGLKYGEKLPSRDIGERLGMKTTAVDMALSRGRRALESCIERRLGSVPGE